MYDWKFYHGTSKAVYESILIHGFKLGENDFHMWLATKGISLACNRPLVARKFAERMAMIDNSEPVVLNVPIRTPDAEYILNLMTDEGMNLFFETYVENFRLLKGPKLGKNTPPEYKEYYQSIKVKDDKFIKLLKQAYGKYTKKPTEVNWDVLATASLILILNIAMIIAVIQDGNTFNYAFTKKEPKWQRTKYFRGIRFRDHIEVCITNPEYIEYTNITVVEDKEQMKDYDKLFIQTMTNPIMPDA